MRALSLESLEERQLLSTIIVNNPTDAHVDGQTDLREAVAQAASDSTDDTITFDSTVFNAPTTITLTSSGINLSKVTGSLTITSLPSAIAPTVAGTGIVGFGSVFTVNSGATVTISGLSISGGNAQYGGGINNSGTLTLDGVTITANAAYVATVNFGDDTAGGGIFNSGSLTINASTISNNTVSADSDNYGRQTGGGIDNSGTLIIDSTTISGNSINGNQTAGGGICEIDRGSGNTGSMTVSNSTISANSAPGYSYNGGGGIYFYAEGTATLTNDTIANNSTGGYGGAGIWFGGGTGGGTLTLTNDTIAGNTGAVEGGGLYFPIGSVTVGNTIIAGNTSTNGTPDIYANDAAYAPITSLGHNLIGAIEGSNGFGATGSGELTGSASSPLDPLLAPLGNNGGPTRTMALLAGSPAIGAGAFAAAGATVDQRGYTRPNAGNIDIGAYQTTAASSATPPTVPAVSPAIADDGTASFSLTASSATTDASALVFTITSLPSGTLYDAGGNAVSVGETFTGSPVAFTYAAPSVIFGDFTDSFGFSVTDTNNVTTTSTVNLSLAASSAGVAQIFGTSGDDSILATNSEGDLAVTLNGVLYDSVAAMSSVTQINVFGGNGNDTVVIDGLPINTTIIGGTGSDNLIINGTGDADTFSVNNANAVVFDGATITGPAPFTINGNGGGDTYNILSPSTTVSINPGGGGNDYVFSDGAWLSGDLNGGGGDTIDLSAFQSPLTLDVDNFAVYGLIGYFSGVSSVIAPAAFSSSNTVYNPNQNQNYNITGTDSGNVAGISFSHFGILAAGTGYSNFNFSDGASISGDLYLSGGEYVNLGAYTTPVSVNFITGKMTGVGGTVSGLGGVDALVGGGSDSSSNTITLSGGTTYAFSGSDSAVNPNTYLGDFANFGNVIATGGGNDFIFSDGATLSGSLTGSGSDTIDLSAYTTGVSVDFSNSTITGIGGTFSGVSSVISGTAGGTLTGPAAASTYYITGADSGNVGGISFTGFGSLTAGPGPNDFIFSDGATLSGSLNGGGNDQLDFSAYTSPLTVDIGAMYIPGIINGFLGFTTLIGNGATSTLGGPYDYESTFQITGADSGYTGGIAFYQFGTLRGEGASDDFIFSDGATLSGSVIGAGFDTIDLSAYTTRVSLNTSKGSVTGVSGSFSGVTNFIGSAIVGGSVSGPSSTTYNITGADSGNVGGISFTHFDNIVAGAGPNDYVFSDNVKFSSALNCNDGDTIDLSAYSSTLSLATYSGGIVTNQYDDVVCSFSGGATVIGNSAFSSLNYVVGGDGSTFSITGSDSGNVDGIGFSNFGNVETSGTNTSDYVFSDGASLSGLVFGTGSTTIDLSAYTSPVTVDLSTATIRGVVTEFLSVANVIGSVSNSQNNTLTGYAGTTYGVTGTDSENVSGIAFSNFGTLIGQGDGNDFVFSHGATLSGSLTGGGSDTLDFSALGTPVAVDLGAGTATGVGGTFSGVTSLIASTTKGGTLTGPAAGSTFHITSATTGNVGGVSFSGFNNITGGAGDDTFALAAGVAFPGILDGGGGTNTLDESAYTTKVTLNVATATVTGLTGPLTNIQSVIAGSFPVNPLYGPTVDSTFNITGTNAGNVGGISFSGFGNLFGGAGNDVFVFSNGAKLTGGLNGGAGVNTIDLSAYTTPTSINLPVSRVTGAGNFSSIQSFIGGSNVSNKVQGPNTASVFNISAANAGSVAGVNFTGFGNLVGGTADDSFIFSAGAKLTGGVDGGTGTNTLDLSAYTTQVSVNLPVSRATGAGNFTSIQSFLGGSYYANKVAAPNTSSSFSVTGANVGTVNGLSFSGFGSLVGGTGDDTFVFSAGATLTGGIDGGGGDNMLDLSAYTTATSINMPASRVTGAGNYASIQSFIGGTNFANKVSGPNTSSVFNVTSANAGNVAGVNFSGFGNFVGGAGDDTFLFSAGATLAGGIDGGGGGNTLDLSAYTTATSINMPASRVTGAGNFASIQSFIGGTNIANKVTGVDTGNTFNITGANTGNVGGLNFSGFGNLVGGAGDDSFVFSAGATLTGGLIGGGGSNTVNLSAYTTATSINMPASRVSGLGGTYSGIQSFIGGTNAKNKVQGPNTDSVFNITGANAGNVAGVSFSGFGSLVGGTGNDIFVFSDGASLTGSIDGGTGTNWIDMGAYSTNVTINLATGKATGVGGTFSNIQNARGGAGNDTLTGNSAGNILIGGAGNDTIKGGSGRSILIGGTGVDTVIGGSGDDIVIGGSTTFDNDNTALDAILAEWQSVDDFATRIADIKNGGGLNGTNVLNLVTTVIDDLAANVLTGGTGNDWFFQGTNDTITDQDGGDQVN